MLKDQELKVKIAIKRDSTHILKLHVAVVFLQIPFDFCYIYLNLQTLFSILSCRRLGPSNYWLV